MSLAVYISSPPECACIGTSGALLTVDIDFGAALGLLLVAAASCVILKAFGFRGAPLVAVIASVALISCYRDSLLGIGGIFSELSASSDLLSYVSAALKVVGISYLSGISADVCREIGEGGIAKTVSVVTRIELVVLSLPYIREILSSVTSLLNS